METRLKVAEEQLRDHDRIIRGNGSKGILVRLLNLELAVLRNSETGAASVPERVAKLEANMLQQIWLLRIVLGVLLLIAGGGDIPSLLRMIFP